LKTTEEIERLDIQQLILNIKPTNKCHLLAGITQYKQREFHGRKMTRRSLSCIQNPLIEQITNSELVNKVHARWRVTSSLLVAILSR